MVPENKRFTWSPQKQSLLLQEVKSGKTIKKAAETVGVPANTAGNWARAAGLGRFPNGRKSPRKRKAKMLEGGSGQSAENNRGVARVNRGGRYDATLKKNVIAALKSGVSVRDAASQFSINQKAVEQWAWLYRPGKTAKRNKQRHERMAAKKPVKKTMAAPAVPQKSVETTPKTVSHHSADRTLVAGFLVSSHKSPGGLLDEAKLLLDRLMKEASFGTHT